MTTGHAAAVAGISRRTFLGGLAGLAAGASLPAAGALVPDRDRPYVIDCHIHYNSAPRQLQAYREAQLTGLREAQPVLTKGNLGITDDQIRASIEGVRRMQRERGTNMAVLSPRGVAMGHHIGNETTSRFWAEHCNELVHRICLQYPRHFAGACQLPQSPGVRPSNCIRELERCVKEFGFVACVLNPDPSGGYWSDPPLTDRWWYPLYEWMVDLDVPALIHGSASRNPSLHTSGAHYISIDTAAFVQLVTSNLFRDFPGLRFVLSHGGGAVPYQWGRYRAMLQDMGRGPLEDLLGRNLFFDTCVYSRAAMELLLGTVPVDHVLFGSEMTGVMRGIDPRTGHAYDDTKRYIDAIEWLKPDDRQKILGGNAMRVFPRLAGRHPRG